MPETAERDASFLLLATIERDAFGLFAQTHQTEAEVGFEALLPVAEADQRAPDQVGEHRPAARVKDGHPEHVAGDRDFKPADRQRDAA